MDLNKFEIYKELVSKLSDKPKFSYEFFDTLCKCISYIQDNTEYMNPKTSWDWFNRACTHDMISDFSHYRYSYKKGVVPSFIECYEKFNKDNLSFEAKGQLAHIFSAIRCCKRYLKGLDFDWSWTYYSGSCTLGDINHPIRTRKVKIYDKENNKCDFLYTQEDLDAMLRQSNKLQNPNSDWYKDSVERTTKFIDNYKKNHIVYDNSLYDEINNIETLENIYKQE